MLVAGIIGRDEECRTTNLINDIFSTAGKKVSIIDAKDLIGLDARLIKSYVNELEKNNVEVLILKINIFDIENEIFNYLHFDIMIYNDSANHLSDLNTESYAALMRRVFSFLDEKGTAIVNVDYNELIKFLQGLNRYVVTYGFNPKASITASSTGDNLLKNSFMCCLQRTISARNGELVEPQEYRINVESDEVDAYNVLAAASFAIVNGVDLNQSANNGLKS